MSDDSTTATEEIKEELHELEEAYSEGADRPLGGYLTLMSTFISLFIGFLLLVRGRKQELPYRFALADIALLGVATHHLGRILSKAGVTSPLRAPFTEFEGASGPPAEIHESVRGTGLRHAIGELVTCPFCTGLWVAAFFSYGLVLVPRVTRLIGSIFVVDAISDNLHLLYDALANVVTKTPDILEQKVEESSHDG